MNLPDTPRYQRVEKLARELRREIELGIMLGELEPCFGFDFIVHRSDYQRVLKGSFILKPFKLPGYEGDAA